MRVFIGYRMNAHACTHPESIYVAVFCLDGLFVLVPGAHRKGPWIVLHIHSESTITTTELSVYFRGR